MIHAKKNAIVVCCTANQIPYAAVTLLSCRDHVAADVADLHLIVPDATDEDERKFGDFAAARSLRVSLHRVLIDSSANELEHNSFSVGTVLRLYMDRWISHHYERVLYLDTDILAVGPVNTVFEIDLGRKPLGAVEDVHSIVQPNGIRLGAGYYGSLRLRSNSKYFNSGVLLFDWKAVVGRGRLLNCIRTGLYMRASGIEQKFADQDILNVEFEDDWMPLNAKYNVMSLYAPHLGTSAVFRHFAGLSKPWDEMLHPQSFQYGPIYRRYLKGSPWQLPARLKWKKNAEWSFREHYLNKFNFAMRRALRAQLPSD
jgi:lipopolysaccharide biosynthesis glycosyltransferase